MEISPAELGALRMRAQCLEPRLEHQEWLAAIRAVGGVNAQRGSAMLLALRARVNGLTEAEVEEAIQSTHEAVRTWAMRGTLHLLAAEDVHWLVSLLGPIFSAKDKRRRLQLGLDEAKATKGLKEIRALLHDGKPQTRGELVERLAAKGFVIERKSQAPIHLIAQAALEGIICLGPDREDGEPTYVLLDNWVKPQPSPAKEAALAQLVHRYLEGYAPASPNDFAAWSGLSVADTKKGWESVREAEDLVEVRLESRSLWMLTSAAKALKKPAVSEPMVRLIPAFDTYLLGYADRDYVVPPKYQTAVYHGGQVVPVVLVNGSAAGVWRHARQGKHLTITVSPFKSFDRQLKQLIAEEAENIGWFLGLTVEVRYGA